ncbi:hypothetical protein ACIGXM_14080 [Kitasatospora sp. NPDC052896]|uniref:hypothetical protein n=1 Tax=Kitasatospora sp. NPDC052896 TaxID=3364061 RepID=UPI0037CB5552
MTTPIWNLETNSDLTAEPGSAAGNTTFPPETAAQRIAARPSNYGKPFVPPTPIWGVDGSGNPTNGGFITPTSFQLFWHSNIGQIPAGSKMPPLPPTASADPNNLGSKGIDSIGIGGHNIYINGAANPSLFIRGSKLNTVVTGYWSTATPPVWTPVAPSTTYFVRVEPVDTTLVATGNLSATLSVTTPAATTTSQQVTTPPGPPGGVTLVAPLPVITSSAGGPIEITWNRISTATGYEVWDNNTPGDDLQPDPSRPGFFIGDTLIVGSIAQPALPATAVTVYTPNYTVPRTPFRIRVRSIKTDSNGTAYSAFSPTMYGTIPAALAAPAAPAAPTLGGTITAGLVHLDLTEPAVSPTAGPPEWYAVYDGTKRVALLNAPLGTAPQVTLQYAVSQAYSFTVVCGNSLGVSPASAALAGTTPAT